ncbi:hypothetical protein ACFLUT_01110 [Chloroflexota bacterium]
MEEALSKVQTVMEELTAYALQYNLVLPNEGCLNAHAAKYVELGHCPCDDRRPSCPCDEALDDIDTMGRCECGVLIDPVRLLENREYRCESKPD